MTFRKLPVVLVLAFLAFTPCASLAASTNDSPVEFKAFSNPPGVPPGGIIYGEAVVTNIRPEPVNFVIWGGIFLEDVMVLEIAPVAGFLNAWEDHLFPIPVQIPEDFTLGRYRIELFIGPTPREAWQRDGRPFMVKFPPPVTLKLFANPLRLMPGGKAWASAIVRNESGESASFEIWGAVNHEETLYLEFLPTHLDLGPGEERLVMFPIQIVESAPLGLYRVRMAIGPRVGRDWNAAEAFFQVRGDNGERPPLVE